MVEENRNKLLSYGRNQIHVLLRIQGNEISRLQLEATLD